MFMAMNGTPYPKESLPISAMALVIDCTRIQLLATLWLHFGRLAAALLYTAHHLQLQVLIALTTQRLLRVAARRAGARRTQRLLLAAIVIVKCAILLRDG